MADEGLHGAEPSAEEALQLPLEAVGQRAWNLVVVGAGPAGSMCALTAARKGLRVLLLDAKAFPREKVCGDCLIPDSLNFLGRNGLLEEVRGIAHCVKGVSLFSPSRAELKLGGEFLTAQRSRLDAVLAAAAVRSGAVFARGRVVEIEDRRDRVLLTARAGETRVIETRVTALTTGAEVSLARAVGLVTRDVPSAVAARCYVVSRLKVETLVISYDGSILPGYGWIFPMGDGLYNLGVGAAYAGKGGKTPRLPDQFAAFTSRFPLAAALMAEAESQTPLRGAPIRFGLSGARGHQGNVLASGEVMGTTFPFTAEGIGKAMESGELAGALAAEALAQERPEVLAEYPERLESQFRGKYRGYSMAQRYFSHAWLADAVLRRASRGGYLREVFQGIVDETADPAEIFSPRGVLRALLG